MGEVKGKGKKLKLWHIVLFSIGIIMLIVGLIGLTLPNPFSSILKVFDNPRYAPGEAIAMVERVYKWEYSRLYEEYLGDGIWEVKSSRLYYDGRAIFRVYEETDTAQIYSQTAKRILDKR